MEQRKKGSKPPLFRNNFQGQPTPKEPTMTEEMGKIPRKPPIKCWGCGGDHMFRDCPHMGEKHEDCSQCTTSQNNGGHGKKYI